ncbi:MAG: bifunctional 4-hydroxy-2-oxoglutarate aldolase/2-dehydro-3-deoxy-phosphogluconate aldolase [Candidatus Nanopelagicales bacterium]
MVPLDLAPIDLATHGPIIPVIVLPDIQDAVPLARALVAGGVRVLGITLRTPAALASMQRIVAEVPEAIVGAGTLRTVADAEAARSSGCTVGVSPGFSAQLADRCRDIGLPLLPGVSTASEVMQAGEHGYSFLKLFPAAAVGGVTLLEALAGPFPDVTFCPTGGITIDTAPDYLALPNVAVCGGTWLTPREVLAAGDWAEVTRRARVAQALAGVPGSDGENLTRLLADEQGRAQDA